MHGCCSSSPTRQFVFEHDTSRHRSCAARAAGAGILDQSVVRAEPDSVVLILNDGTHCEAGESVCRWDDAFRAQSSLETRTSSADAIESGIHSSGPCLSTSVAPTSRTEHTGETQERHRARSGNRTEDGDHWCEFCRGAQISA